MKTSSPRPELKMLDRADCERIHQASCEILEQIGVVFHHDEALALLRNAGAVVSDNLVKIPPGWSTRRCRPPRTGFPCTGGARTSPH